MCSTPNYENETTARSFGERFVLWKMKPAGPRAVALRAMKNASSSEQQQKELAEAMELLNSIAVPKTVNLGQRVLDVLADEVVFAAKARTPVLRHNYTREIDEIPSEESTGRISGQIAQLMRGLLVLRGLSEPHEEDLLVIETCIFSCIPEERLRVMAQLSKGPVSRGELIKRTKLPRKVADRTIEDLDQLGLIRDVGGKKKAKPKPGSKPSLRPGNVKIVEGTAQWNRFFVRVRRVLERYEAKEA